jgi:protein SCO1/2
MTNPSIISTNKLIALIVFICAALMTSLFVYHSTQKTPKPILSPDIGLIFSVPRDIKPFKLTTAKNEPFTERNLYHHWTLLFFGFTHCADFCPTTLTLMTRIYPKLHQNHPNLQFIFLSIDPERDTPDVLKQYTQSYHPDFMAVTGKIHELHKLQSQLGIVASRVPGTQSTHYQMQHTTSILLINPQGKWAGLFPYGLKPNELINGIETSIHSLEHHA